MSEDQKKLLEQQLWNIANTLRGKMGADEFRDYILGFIFYKYLSEKQFIYANYLLEGEEVKDYNKVTDLETLEAIKEDSLIKLGYVLRPDDLFQNIAKKGNAKIQGQSNFILEDLQRILNSIEQSTMGTESEDDFVQLFEDLNLSSAKLGRTVEERNELIAKVLFHLDKIDFQLEDTEADLLGDAYEYLIAQFASGAGKKAGEFYTPQQVSKILAQIVTTGKTKLKSVYDPTCGSGSLLLRVGKEVKEVSEYYGQELNRTTYNLARMNMILHGVHYRNFDLKQEDTLVNPQHLDHRFEAIVANPPFSAQWKGKDNPLNNTDERFSQYGKLAPTSKADFAFVLHMIHHLAENGTMAIVLPHGALFRSGAEQHIRKYLIEDRNYLDAVIGLPANLFYGTPIPTCIMVFKKCKENPNDVLFINAAEHFERGTQNTLRQEDIDRIVTTYRERKEVEKYSSLATLDFIAKNEYNLNIPRYVNTFEEQESVDIASVAKQLRELEKEMKNTDAELTAFCKELKIDTPF